MIDEELSWEHHIPCPKSGVEPAVKLKSRTCVIYHRQAESVKDANELCACGRRVNRHSFVGDSLYSRAISSDEKDSWENPKKFLDLKKHSAHVEINVFGTLKPSGCKFIRLDVRTKAEDLFELIKADCGKPLPGLILSIYGGAKYFTMTEQLEKEFIRGVIDAATMASKRSYLIFSFDDN